MNFLKYVVLTLIVLWTAGCSSTLRQMDSYGSPAPIVQAAAMPVIEEDVDVDVEEATDIEAQLIAERGHEPQIVEHHVGDLERNTILIVTSERKLYVSNGDGYAVAFPIAVGKEGFGWTGEAVIGAKKVNPTWTPPASMIERKPELAEWADGMPGGPDNPLGVRALYLHTYGGEDTMYRIHGTNAPETIGTAASSGCIRMYNQHVSWLYERLEIGDRVIVSPGDDIAWVDTDESEYE